MRPKPVLIRVPVVALLRFARVNLHCWPATPHYQAARRPCLAKAVGVASGLRWFALTLLLAALTSPLRAAVVISELFYHPASEQDRDEWVELHNTGPLPVDLSGWQFTEGVRFTFPAGSGIPAGGRVVVAADPAAFAANHPGVGPVLGGWQGILSNSGETVTLVNATGIEVDSVPYADEGDWAPRIRDAVDAGHRGWTWASPADGGGFSLELIQPGLPRQSGQNWSASTVTNGTPGGANSAARANAAPLVFEARHFPLVPASTNAVLISARLLDEEAASLSSVTLHWRLDGAPRFAELRMRDDGTGGDTLPNDGLFAALIPAQTNGAIVEFWFLAADRQGNTRAWPAPVLDDGVPRQVANCLYQVDDTVPAALPGPGELPRYRLIQTAAERAELRAINENFPAAPHPTSNQTASHAQFNATFITHDGTGAELRYLVGVRNRGNGSRSRPPQSFRVNLRSDQPWRGETALNLNSQYTPAQLLGGALYRRAGLPAAQSRPVLVRVNGRDLQTAGSPNYGFYLANEVINSEFAGRAFPEDSAGNLYRGIRLTGRGADLGYLGEEPDPYRANYFKQSNASQDDWTDLIALTRALASASPETYAAEVRAEADVDEWMLYFALETLVDNKETNLANGNNGSGHGDDYFLYFGRNDPRGRLVPYDLDTILGIGNTSFNVNDGLFRMAANPVLDRFIKHPEFVPLYFRKLVALAEHDFAPEHFNPLVDQMLGGLVPESTRRIMKDFAAARRAAVLAMIPRALTATNTTVPFLAGRYVAETEAFPLGGQVNVLTTHTLTVNGQPVAFTAWTGGWRADLTNRPGLNRFVVQTFDAGGQETERLNVSVEWPGSSTRSVDGELAQDLTLTAAEGPWLTTQGITVPTGRTLTLEPGTTLYFAGEARLTANGGRIFAEGTESAPVHFQSAPDTTGPWGGISLQNTGTNESRFAHIRVSGAAAPAIQATASTVRLEHAIFTDTAAPYVDLTDSSFLIHHSTFPPAAAPLLRGHGLPATGWGVIAGSWFGPATGTNDLVQFTGGQRPGAILELYDNVFAGPADDLVELRGADAHLEGNLFLQARGSGTDGDTANAVSAGGDGLNASEVTLARNLFYDCDHLALAKDGSFLTLEHNTAVGISQAALSFDEPARRETGVLPGLGARLERNLFALVRTNVESAYFNHPTFGSTRIEGWHNLSPVLEPLTFNQPFQFGDPRLRRTNGLASLVVPLDAARTLVAFREAFALEPGSDARSQEDFLELPTTQDFFVADLGANVPAGLSFAHLPARTNTHANWNVRVNGPGQTAYRWRLNGGPWSQEFPFSEPLRLIGLTDGTYVLEAQGRSSTGRWQEPPTIAPASTVDATFQRVELWRVLARPGAGDHDRVDLAYWGNGPPLDLGGWSLATSTNEPRRFVFPGGQTITANGSSGFLLGDDAPGPGPRPDFGLSARGDTLFLYDPQTNLVDSLRFGPQLEGYLLGRLRQGGPWKLLRRTPDASNPPAPTGDVARVRLNEWLAASGSQFADDYVELFNADPLPVEIGGLFLSDDPVGRPRRHPLPPLSFIGGRGHLLLIADGDPEEGGDHLDFRLAAESGIIELSEWAEPIPPATEPVLVRRLDTVFYGPQFTDVSQGRSPNGAAALRYFLTPTPGGGNPPPPPVTPTNVTTLTFELVSLTNAWRFLETAAAPANWAAPDFDDRSWPEGFAAFALGGDPLPVPVGTTLTTDHITAYFRTEFTPPTNAPGLALQLQTLVDDGCVVWLNGTELYRENMPDGGVTDDTRAADRVDVATLFGPVTVPATSLLAAANTLAVEVHQNSSQSTDLTFALRLFATLNVTNTGPAPLRPVVLNEILARNFSLPEPDGSFPDWVELFNPNDRPLDLYGLTLTDDLAQPDRYQFPPETVIAARGYRRILFDTADAFHTPRPDALVAPFGLNGDGDRLFLLDTPETGRAVLDGVAFGLQVADLTLARVPDGDGAWQLAQPTPGDPNLAQPLADAAGVVFNEWLASPSAGDDWFELFNPALLPVDLSGWHLTDDLEEPAKHTLPPLTFLGTGPHAYVQMLADENLSANARHVDFRLSANGESLGLGTPAEQLVHFVHFGPATRDVSQGRLPDAAATIVSFPSLPTPAAPNRADADRDALPDDWELASGLNPADPLDALADPDGDGHDSLAEFRAGTDPQDADSRLELLAGLAEDGRVWLGFTAQPGVAYTVEHRATLTTAGWELLGELPARTGPRSVTFPAPDPNAATGYYRVSVRP